MSITRLMSLLLLLCCSLTMSDELKLTVVVKGVMNDKDEPVPIRKATVTIENSGYSSVRRTNTNGKSTFKLEAGRASILVTGQDTEKHWATGFCSVKVVTDLVVNFQLDLEQTTQKCEVKKNPLASSGVSEANEGHSGDAEKSETTVNSLPDLKQTTHKCEVEKKPLVSTCDSKAKESHLDDVYERETADDDEKDTEIDLNFSKDDN